MPSLTKRIVRMFDGRAGLIDAEARAAIQLADGSYADAVIPLNLDGTPAVEPPIQGIIDMPVAGTVYTAGRSVEIVTTTAGLLTLTYTDGSTRTRAMVVGLMRMPDAVMRWTLPNGSTFVGTICNLR